MKPICSFAAFAEQYLTASFAGTGNNHCLLGEVPPARGRIAYPITHGGTFPFAFLFQNRVDSTFDAGQESRADLVGGVWRLGNALVGVSEDPTAPLSTPLTFEGKGEKEILPDEIFASDEVTLTVKAGEYLIISFDFEGRDIPYTPDKSLIPTYREEGGVCRPATDLPQPVLVGCRAEGTEVTFLGDSITQGLGTAPFAYEFWVARLANALPEGVFVRNLGLGFARAEDAARDGVWLKKAKTAKRVVLCLGTNDLLQRSRRGDANLASLVFEDVRKTALLLKAAGARVFLLSVPPFDWQGDVKEAWQNVNLRLQNEVAPLLDGFFVTARVWGKAPPMDNEAAYTDERSGSHPNGEGGRAMAEALLPHLVNFLQLQA